MLIQKKCDLLPKKMTKNNKNFVSMKNCPKEWNIHKKMLVKIEKLQGKKCKKKHAKKHFPKANKQNIAKKTVIVFSPAEHKT